MRKDAPGNYSELPSGMIRVQLKINGERASGSFPTIREAEDWAWKTSDELRAGAVKNVSTATVRQLFQTYLTSSASKTDSAKWNGLRLKKWCSDPIADLLVANVTTHDVNLWIDRRLATKYRSGTISGSTVCRELNLMSGAFKYAIHSLEWIAGPNPCHGAQRPAENAPRKRPLLTPQEILALETTSGYSTDPELQTLTARTGACFLLSLETGMRSGEILRLKPAHYNPEARTIRVAAEERGGRKGSQSGRRDSARNVPLSGRALELLDQLQSTRVKAQPYIVGVNDSQRDSLWRKARKRAGVQDLTFHDTKHEACTRLSKFIDVFALSHAVGTKDLQLLRDTYYNADASATAKLLPEQVGTKGAA